MKKLPIIQYLPLTRPKAVKKFLKTLHKANVMSILDLEDSAQDPFNTIETARLKAKAREGLSMISKEPGTNQFSNVYIRVNALDSDYYKDDIASVRAACSNGMNIKGVFLPKVENYSFIMDLSQRLYDIEQKIEIIPMIETVEGMKNLHIMLEEDKNNDLFNRIHYGHFDFCLDAKIWPYSDPCHKEFWEIIKPIAELIQNFNKTYIHTPFPFPSNEELFWSSSFYLQNEFPALDIWICTLNSELSTSKQPSESKLLKLIDSEFSKEYLIDEAKKICYEFLVGRANKRSFSVSEDRFIPPHQYFSAKNYLNTIGEA